MTLRSSSRGTHRDGQQRAETSSRFVTSWTARRVFFQISPLLSILSSRPNPLKGRGNRARTVINDGIHFRAAHKRVGPGWSSSAVTKPGSRGKGRRGSQWNACCSRRRPILGSQEKGLEEPTERVRGHSETLEEKPRKKQSAAGEPNLQSDRSPRRNKTARPRNLRNAITQQRGVRQVIDRSGFHPAE